MYYYKWDEVLDERQRFFLAQRLQGYTYQQIADGAGITQERARQIIAKIDALIGRYFRDRV